MITVSRILCPVDFSDHSRRALEHAALLARWYGASIRVLHVHTFVPPPPSRLPGWARPRLTDEERAHYLKEMRDLAAPALGSGAEPGLSLVEGDPIVEILETAAAERADLIVMGTHGRGGFQRLVLGSLTEKVLRRASCPVLTVPPRAAGPEGAERPAFGRILCPVDFSEASLTALEYALALARESRARITLLHAIEGLAEAEPLERAGSTVAEWLRFQEERARRRLEELVPAGARDWCEPEVAVAIGRAHREILRAAEAGRAELIVMGVLGRGALDLALFGSTTQQVVRQAGCPVLTVRPRA
jgi:nucleotide-binding universal stress UspA family protein